MSCSTPLPSFVCDSLYYLNRNQLERFTIISRPLKNFIARYLHSKPYRIFDELRIRRRSYVLIHKGVQWRPNRDDYNVQQFLAGQKCSIGGTWNNPAYYSFDEMRPYLAPTVRVNWTSIVVTGVSTFNAEHIEEMESIAYLWRDGNIYIDNAKNNNSRIVADDFRPILNSPTILQCRSLVMINAYFSFKDFNVLYKMKVIVLEYNGDDNNDSNYWREFLEQPEAKPIVALHYCRRKNIDALDLLKEAFSSTVLPNAFKVVFVQHDESLSEFRETNNISGEKLELKKGLPAEYQELNLKEYHSYTLERSTI